MMSSTMKQWSVDVPDKDFRGMKYTTVPIPEVGDDEVLVKFKAASINFRDLAIAKVHIGYSQAEHPILMQ